MQAIYNAGNNDIKEFHRFSVSNSFGNVASHNVRMIAFMHCRVFTLQYSRWGTQGGGGCDLSGCGVMKGYKKIGIELMTLEPILLL